MKGCTVCTYLYVPIALAITIDMCMCTYVHTVCTVLTLMASTASSVFLAIGPFLSSSPSPAPPSAGTHTLLPHGARGSVQGCVCLWLGVHVCRVVCMVCTCMSMCVCMYSMYVRTYILYPPNMKCSCVHTFVYYECWFLTFLCIVAAPLLLLCTTDNRAKSSGQVQLHCTATWRAVL